MGIEGRPLKDHGQVAAMRWDVRHVAVADMDVAAGGRFETGDEPQQRRFAAPGGTDEDEEFAVGDVERSSVQTDDAVGILFGELIERNVGHEEKSRLPASALIAETPRPVFTPKGLHIAAVGQLRAAPPTDATARRVTHGRDRTPRLHKRAPPPAIRPMDASLL